MGRKISILGATGSIGVNTLKVIDSLKEEIEKLMRLNGLVLE